MDEKFFPKGSIVDFVEANKPVSDEVEKYRRQLRNDKPYKLVILRKYAPKLYLVAVCCQEKKDKYLLVNTEKESLYIRVSEFRIVDEASLQLCADLCFLNKRYDVVDEIYSKHDAYVKERRKINRRKCHRKYMKTQATKKTRRRGNVEKKSAKDKKRNYENEYECAIINNDREKMREIEEILGSAPDYAGMSSRKKRKATPYSSFNPVPYRGGRFTPK